MAKPSLARDFIKPFVHFFFIPILSELLAKRTIIIESVFGRFGGVPDRRYRVNRYRLFWFCIFHKDAINPPHFSGQ